MAGPTDETRTDRRRFRRQVPIPYGDPCPRCGQPLMPDQIMEAGHADDVADHGPGPLRWEHRLCNRQAGDRRNGTPIQRRARRSW